MAEPQPVHARAYDLAIGQIAEWLVWTQLVATSLGDLHVFLPLKDQGIDGIVHRTSTDEYAGEGRGWSCCARHRVRRGSTCSRPSPTSSRTST